MSVATVSQNRELLLRIMSLLSDMLQSISNDFDADATATKNYVRTIRTANDSVEFLDGNSNVVFKIPVMKE